MHSGQQATKGTFMTFRKASLVAAVLAGLLLGQLALAGGTPLWAQYVPGPKFTIVNKSGFPDKQIHVLLIGIPNSEKVAKNFHHILWAHDGFLATFPIIDPGDNTVDIGGKKYADYSTTLDKLSKDGDGNYYFYVPKAVDSSVPSSQYGIGSTRVYLSYQKPVYVQVISATSLAQPNIANTSAPNFNTFFDWYELAVDVDGTSHSNTTKVDFLGMPIEHLVKNAT
jgi:hypothetical protein